jgi:TolA-binding protein
MFKKAHDRPPHRLSESTDIGPLLQKAAAVSFDENRLQHSRAALLSRIEAKSAEGAGRFRFYLVPRRHVAWAALAVLLLVSAGAAAVIYWNASIAQSSNGVVDKGKREAARQKRAGHKTDNLISLQTETSGDAESSSDVTLQGKPRHPLDKVPSPDSTLEEQVRLFEKAKTSMASGDYNSAFEHLNRLKQRYPASPLSLDAKELTAHVLAGLKRYRQASLTVAALIRAKIPTRKKAQLYRFLGDLQVKQNLCDNAVENYRRALGLGLSVAETEAAKAGIRECLP